MSCDRHSAVAGGIARGVGHRGSGARKGRREGRGEGGLIWHMSLGIQEFSTFTITVSQLATCAYEPAAPMYIKVMVCKACFTTRLSKSVHGLFDFFVAKIACRQHCGHPSKPNRTVPLTPHSLHLDLRGSNQSATRLKPRKRCAASRSGNSHGARVGQIRGRVGEYSTVTTSKYCKRKKKEFSDRQRPTLLRCVSLPPPSKYIF